MVTFKTASKGVYIIFPRDFQLGTQDQELCMVLVQFLKPTSTAKGVTSRKWAIYAESALI